MATSTKDVGDVCRIGVMSRIDFGSDGYRHGLLVRAAETFARQDVNYVILAAGLVSQSAFKAQNLKQVSDIRDRLRGIRMEMRVLRPKMKPGKNPNSHARYWKLDAEKEELQELLDELRKGPDVNTIADDLYQALPKFENAKGDRVKLHIVTAPAYDGWLGEAVAVRLSRKKHIYSYRPGHDELLIGQADKRLEVLVPEKAIWMRGDYYSTPHERLLKDRDKQRDGAPPDIQLVAGFGATIVKPQGEAPRPWVAAPVLHRIQETRVAENQVGVLTMEVHRGRKDPIVKMFTFKGIASRERTYVRTPGSASDLQKGIVELIKAHGKLSTGTLADRLNAPRQDIEKAADALRRDNDTDPRKTWSGLMYYEDSHRWDLDRKWLMHHLTYPEASSVGHRTDKIVSFGCPHLGSVNTDVIWFVDQMPKLILQHGVNVFACAGDVKEGHKHNLILRGEVYRGMNDSTQEELAGKVFGHIIGDVFTARFAAAIKPALDSGRGRVSTDLLGQLIDSSLLLFIVIPGNHDLWSLDDGHTPLVLMKAMLARHVERVINTALRKHGLAHPSVYEIVRRKIVEPPHGRTKLPSGLRVSLLHPHMARSKTTSMRPQQMLAKELGTPEVPGSQVVIGANFHVAEVLAEYDGSLGQRICIQCGTLKHRTGFEDNLLKIVDQGVVFSEITSDGERIVSLETFHQGNDSRKFDRTENGKMYDALLDEQGL